MNEKQILDILKGIQIEENNNTQLGEIILSCLPFKFPIQSSCRIRTGGWRAEVVKERKLW
jgi:hypothetical protein